MSSHIRILAQDPNFSLLFHLATPSFLPLLLSTPSPRIPFHKAMPEQGKCRYFSHTHTKQSHCCGRRRCCCCCCCRHLTHTSDLRFSHASKITTTILELRVCVCMCVHMLCFCWCCVFSTLILIAWHWLRTRRQQSSRAEQQHSCCYCAVTNGTLRNMACVASLCIT